MLSQVKLIAEPWDVGPGGYQVGNFPVLWSEWNGKYRDSVRRFWKGDGGTVSEFATRLVRLERPLPADRPAAVRQHQFHHLPRRLHACKTWSPTTTSTTRPTARTTATAPTTTIAGTAAPKGPTDDPAIRALRERQKRNFLATLLLSQGVPMLLAGDEIGHTQKGNNNAYCQDNELTWLNWDLNEDQKQFLEFVQKVCRIWREHPVFQRRRFFQGRAIRGSDIKDLSLSRTFGRRDERRRLEPRLRQMPGDAAGRRPDRRCGRAWRANRRRYGTHPRECPSRADTLHPAADSWCTGLGVRSGHAQT